MLPGSRYTASGSALAVHMVVDHKNRIYACLVADDVPLSLAFSLLEEVRYLHTDTTALSRTAVWSLTIDVYGTWYASLDSIHILFVCRYLLHKFETRFSQLFLCSSNDTLKISSPPTGQLVPYGVRARLFSPTTL